MIPPTIGRKVWFFDPSSHDQREQDATIIDVQDDRSVSLFIINRGGTTSVRHSVYLVQEGDEPTPVPNGYATWMPYQIGQAKKHAA